MIRSSLQRQRNKYSWPLSRCRNFGEKSRFSMCVTSSPSTFGFLHNLLFMTSSRNKSSFQRILSSLEERNNWFQVANRKLSGIDNDSNVSQGGDSSTSSNSNEKWDDHREKRWEHMKQQLIEYRKENGDVLVPLSFKDNPKLGIWVDNQRQQYHLLMEGQRSPMTQERIKQLEQEGFIWDVHNHVWQQQFEQLVAYKEKFGNCIIPVKLEGYETLSNWVSTQRKQYTLKKNDRPSSMTEERIEALESIGFIWNVNEETWNQRFEELKQYKAYHGDCLVPGGFASNPKLATWVDLQRTQYRYFIKGDPSLLNEERIKMLEDIGFVWNVYDAKWNAKFEELEEFIEINGHSKVPSSPLARWCNRQRKEYSKYLAGDKSSLTDSRRSKLIKIGLFN